MFCKLLFTVFLMILVLQIFQTQAANNTHICDCLKFKLPSSCLRIQAFTRNNSHIVLIESDNLYEIKSSWIKLVSNIPKIYLYPPGSTAPIVAGLWSTASWFHAIAKHGQLLYYGVYGSEMLPANSSDNATTKYTHHFCMDFGELVVQDRVKLVKYMNGKRFIEAPEKGDYGTIVDGYCIRGLLVQKSLRDGLVRFYDLSQFLLNSTQPPQAYFFQEIKTGSQAQFVAESQSTSVSAYFTSQPYGLISQSNVLLLDVPGETALVFSYSYSIQTTPFSIQSIPIKDFFRCEPPNSTNSTDLKTGQHDPQGNYWTSTMVAIVIFGAIASMCLLYLNYSSPRRHDAQMHRDFITHEIRAAIPKTKGHLITASNKVFLQNSLSDNANRHSSGGHREPTIGRHQHPAHSIASSDKTSS